jgi:hypothetical protein
MYVSWYVTKPRDDDLQVFLGCTASPLLVHDVSTRNHDLNSDCDEKEGRQTRTTAADNCGIESALLFSHNAWNQSLDLPSPIIPGKLDMTWP